jgi:hypothetical protein
MRHSSPRCGIKGHHETKEKLSQWLQENTKITLGDFWEFELVKSFILPLAKRGVEPFASWLKIPKDALIASSACDAQTTKRLATRNTPINNQFIGFFIALPPDSRYV